MRLDLSKIRTAHERYRKVYPPEAFTSDPDYRITEPVTLEFDLHKDKETYRLTGRAHTALELTCSRCLEPFRWTVDEPFELTYEPRTVRAEGEREIADEDFSAAFYENEEIDLEQLLRERFEMSMPMKPLCRDDCNGLCPVCGANLNAATCNCSTTWDDPRLAALKKLQAQQEHKGH